MQPIFPIRGNQPYAQQSQQPPQYPSNPQQPQYGPPPQQYPTNPHYGMQQPYSPGYESGGQQNPPGYFQVPPQNPSSYSMARGNPNQYPAPHPYSPGYQPPPSSTYDIDNSTDATIFLFDNKKIRNRFIRKVYAILSVQMLVTIGLMAIMIFVEPVKEWVQARRYLFWVAFGITLILMIAIGCFTGPRRKFPLNIILLAIFTIAEAFLLGVISISKDTTYVLYSAGITVAIVLAITIFALQTKIDFTYLTGGILILVVIMLAFGIMVAIIRSKLLKLIYCCVGVLVFSIFLLIDTQLMLGGNHTYSISPEDYIFAALNLYVDIVQIFMMVLGIFSNSD